MTATSFYSSLAVQEEKHVSCIPCTCDTQKKLQDTGYGQFPQYEKREKEKRNTECTSRRWPAISIC
jgi:hypothetical protein